MRRNPLRMENIRAASLAGGAALAISVFAAAAAGAPAAWAQSNAAAATIKYTLDPAMDRQIIFVNNPERLELGYTDLVPGSKDYGVTFNDLADRGLGNKTILDITVPEGRYRDVFEHVWNLNRSTATNPAGANPIAYGIRVYNPNQDAITVTVRRKGFINNSNGFAPFATVLNAEATNPNAGTTYDVFPGQSVFILRSEVDFPSGGVVPSGNFFSGVVDFDIAGGPAQVSNFAYQSFDETFFARATVVIPPPFNAFVDLSGPQYMGFITRRYAAGTTPAPETRTYKGLMTYPVVSASGVAQGGTAPAGGGVLATLSYTINDSTTAGDLRVTYPRYINDSNGTLNRYSPSNTVAPASIPATTDPTVVTTAYWYTGNVPIRDTNYTRDSGNNITNFGIQVVANDMFDIQTPGYGTLYALFQSNTPNTIFGQFNVGNWGVIYHDAITVTNNGTINRTFALKLNNNGGSSPLAYRTGTGAWQGTTVSTSPFTYSTFTVPAGQTVTTDAYYVIGCPAVTTLKHTLTLVTPPPAPPSLGAPALPAPLAGRPATIR